MDLQSFIRMAVQVPYKAKGRGFDGWDCWGLLRLAYREIKGIDLPAFEQSYENVRDVHQLRQAYEREKETMSRFVQVDARDKEPLDGVMFFRDGQPVHVGLVVSKTAFIHTDRVLGTVRENFGPFSRAGRVEGFYRYVEPSYEP